MIKTYSLTKVYSSGVKALDNLSIQVYEGEIFGFLGPNGAGKSTTIKILTTLSRPTAGSAWVGGYNVLTEPEKVRCSIGYVAQETGVDYFLTGRENLILQGRLYRMDTRAIHDRVEELLELFDLKESADSLVSTYSGGMRRKLDIATAMIHHPRILFLDEPTLGLDPHSRSNLWNYIRMLNRELKVTIFLTTHYLDEADKLSHRIGILHKGNIKVVDSPEALKDSIKGDSINLSLTGAAREKAISLLRGNWLVKDLLCEDEHVRVYVNNGGEAIPALMKLLNEHGVEITSLSISRPSLDDVYLKYSGVSFKEGESAAGDNPWWAQWKKGGWGKNWKGGKGWDQEGEGKDGEWQKWSQGDGKGDNDWWKVWQEGEENGDKSTVSPWEQEERLEVRSEKSEEKPWKEWQEKSERKPEEKRKERNQREEEKPREKWKNTREEGEWNMRGEGSKDNEKDEEGPDREDEPWKKWQGSPGWEKWSKGGS